MIDNTKIIQYLINRGNNIKVLPLTKYMQRFGCLSMDRDREQLTEVTPIFNRDGWYKIIGLCWFEVGGKAYDIDQAGFNYHLEILNIKRVTDISMGALKILYDNRLLKGYTRDLYINNLRLREYDKSKQRVKLAAFKAIKTINNNS